MKAIIELSYQGSIFGAVKQQLKAAQNGTSRSTIAI